MSQKRRQDPEDDDGDYIDDDGNDRPSHCKRVRATSTLSGFSRERIKYALGGFDRGWGSMQCRPQMKYTHYALLDVKAHLFDLEPSHGEPIAKAIFGFHLADEEVISGGIEFPLFVRSTSENRSQFKYVGNYVAKKLCLIAWERLSREGREDAIKTVRFRGLSDKHYFNSLGKEAAEQHIHRQFETGVYQVPCCRLDFRSYDEDLKTDIQLQAVPLRVRS
ncbi:hypothetical protein BJ322DRAFT_702026 [Thelephora terrestris]|uniref:DUF6697 domain-containing protein n=1 Tax=Thelephora terrestris TaxID=56493 RepID=A0A9P6HJ91_9AGAM|nr:hypothetical protein BJ322DRAFT_702026 [Thelephora terrestris]